MAKMNNGKDIDNEDSLPYFKLVCELCGLLIKV